MTETDVFEAPLVVVACFAAALVTCFTAASGIIGHHLPAILASSPHRMQPPMLGLLAGS